MIRFCDANEKGNWLNANAVPATVSSVQIVTVSIISLPLIQSGKFLEIREPGYLPFTVIEYFGDKVLDC